jgi:chromosomal replication initiator protein
VAAAERSRLNPELTFTSFVSGKANDLARAAALQVADKPGGAYNPLFLYGGVGLGKTHLIQAVGNAILARKPATNIRYITANQFFQDMVNAIRKQSVDAFKRHYHSLDLLLIDDIQFFSGKERSQEEFFYAFENLIAERKQIIISSDTYPREMSGIDDRLISRFNSGLIVAIEPPELEMRVAILMRKAESAGHPLGDDVAYFVAKHIRQNVRELEGALRRILAYAQFHNQPITLEVVKEALKDLLSYNRGQISVDIIQKTVADFYKIKVADMHSKRRPANIALPRQIAMYLAKELTQKSLPEIGEHFGGRDHTTVLHAVRKITEKRLHHSDLNHQIHVLDQTLREYL